ncbi:MAG: 50S ribosomal protein L28 [Clostridiales bacterium]|nr:50S ribosomal protein L28 [Clostridiales bacterium]
MAKCDVCSKDTIYGNNVSHSVRRTGRSWKPNVKKVRVIDNGTHKSVNVCSRCLRSNKVTRTA